MYVPIGYVKRNRFWKLLDASKAALSIYGKTAATPGAPDERGALDRMEKALRDAFGNRISKIMLTPLLALDSWLAVLVHDIFAFAGRLVGAEEQLDVIQRRDSPVPDTADVIGMIAEDHIPAINIPGDVILTPRDVAIMVLNRITDITQLETFASMTVESQMLAAGSHIAYLVRNHETIGQFEKTFLNFLLGGAIFPQKGPSITPSFNPNSMVFLEKLKAKTRAGAGSDTFTLYSTGSIDGAIMVVTPYAPKLPVAMGIVHDFRSGALTTNGIVRLSLEIIEEIPWDLDDHLVGQAEAQPGSLRARTLDQLGAPQLGLTTSVPWTFQGPQAPVLMDDPSVEFIYRGRAFRYSFHSAFRGRTITTTSDSEFLLDRLMDPGRRRKVVATPAENLSLDRFTNAILYKGDQYVVDLDTKADIWFRAYANGAFTLETRTVDLRPLFTFGNKVVRPALSNNFKTSRNFLFTPRPREVEWLASQLGLGDLNLQASRSLLALSYNAAWFKMVMGRPADVDVPSLAKLLGSGV